MKDNQAEHPTKFLYFKGEILLREKGGKYYFALGEFDPESTKWEEISKEVYLFLDERLCFVGFSKDTTT